MLGAGDCDPVVTASRVPVVELGAGDCDPVLTASRVPVVEHGGGVEVAVGDVVQVPAF